MAEELGLSYGALADEMKPLLACRAVEAYRAGRNTRYHLSDAGRRFCRDVLMTDG